MPNGQNELINLSLPKNPQDKNHIIKYFLEEIKSFRNNMKNSEEKLNQEISLLKEQNERYQNEIVKLKEDNKKELLNIKKERQNYFISILIILFVIVLIFSYLINSYKSTLNNNIVNNIKDILNFKREQEENRKYQKSLENKIEKLWRELNENDYIKETPKKLNDSGAIPISFDSKIVSLDSINFILDYLRENDKSFNFDEIKLLYRGSRDGDNTTLCHELCDNKQNVLIVIKSDTGYIFGGYSKIGFKAINIYFIFFYVFIIISFKSYFRISSKNISSIRFYYN